MIDAATRRNFSSLVAAAFADGLLTDDERLILHRKATEWGVSTREMNEMIAQGEQGRISIGVPTSTREREEMLEAMIDIVCADGRVEAPEHHLLAKFASHLKLALPDLRQKINTRMEKRGTGGTRVEPQARPVRVAPAPGDVAPPPPAPSIGAAPAPPKPGTSPPPQAKGPIRLDDPKLFHPGVADVPPVALHLIKQSISFETEEDARRYIERMLSVTKEQAARVLQAVLQAFPDLKRSGGQTQARPKR